MTLEESVQHVVMEAIQEVGGGAQRGKELQDRGSWAQALSWYGLGSAWKSASQISLSRACQLLPALSLSLAL